MRSNACRPKHHKNDKLFRPEIVFDSVTEDQQHIQKAVDELLSKISSRITQCPKLLVIAPELIMQNVRAYLGNSHPHCPLNEPTILYYINPNAHSMLTDKNLVPPENMEFIALDPEHIGDVVASQLHSDKSDAEIMK